MKTELSAEFSDVYVAAAMLSRRRGCCSECRRESAGELLFALVTAVVLTVAELMLKFSEPSLVAD